MPAVQMFAGLNSNKNSNFLMPQEYKQHKLLYMQSHDANFLKKN